MFLLYFVGSKYQTSGVWDVLGLMMSVGFRPNTRTIPGGPWSLVFIVRCHLLSEDEIIAELVVRGRGWRGWKDFKVRLRYIATYAPGSWFQIFLLFLALLGEMIQFV